MDTIIAAPLTGWSTVGLATFGVILLAEMGDKSQIVCMTLAAISSVFLRSSALALVQTQRKGPVTSCKHC